MRQLRQGVTCNDCDASGRCGGHPDSGTGRLRLDQRERQRGRKQPRGGRLGQPRHRDLVLRPERFRAEHHQDARLAEVPRQPRPARPPPVHVRPSTAPRRSPPHRHGCFPPSRHEAARGRLRCAVTPPNRPESSALDRPVHVGRKGFSRVVTQGEEESSQSHRASEVVKIRHGVRTLIGTFSASRAFAGGSDAIHAPPATSVAGTEIGDAGCRDKQSEAEKVPPQAHRCPPSPRRA